MEDQQSWWYLRDKAIELQEFSAAAYYAAKETGRPTDEPKPSAETEARIRAHELRGPAHPPGLARTRRKTSEW
jgi:hypothetical protein